MTSPELLLAFLLAAALICITPGPDMLFVATYGASKGWRGGVAAASGVALGMVLHTLLAASGLSLLITQVPAAYLGLRIVGAVYLAYLGIGLIRSRNTPWSATSTAAPRKSYLSIVGQATAVNVANPKILVFYLAFLPQFVAESGSPVFLQMLVLGMTFAVMGFVTDATIGVFSGRSAAWVESNPRTRSRISLGCGAALIVLAGLFAAGVN